MKIEKRKRIFKCAYYRGQGGDSGFSAFGLFFAALCLAQAEPYVSPTYRLELYWKTETVGFRQRHGEKRQLFSIGGASCPLSMDALQGWAEETLKRLDKSRSWESVRDWVKGMTR